MIVVTGYCRYKYHSQQQLDQITRFSLQEGIPNIKMLETQSREDLLLENGEEPTTEQVKAAHKKAAIAFKKDLLALLL